jgi:dienelactone hydrolase
MGRARAAWMPTSFDISAAIAYLRGRPGVDADRLAIRGSSMGGHYALHAGAACSALKAVVAICPASETDLERGIFNADFWRSIEMILTDCTQRSRRIA